jgi:chemotaxis protein MotA
MEGLREKKYLIVTRKRFDPIALLLAAVGIFYVALIVLGTSNKENLFDFRSFVMVIGGSIAVVLFQFDFSTLITSFIVILKSLLGGPEKKIVAISRQLDDTILNGLTLKDIREGRELTGELLNDIVYMNKQGLIFEEIDEFITSKISEEFLRRNNCVDLLEKASTIAPALGLFGTVIGLIGVLKNLSTPDQIGPNMSLALMTTAYGAALSYLVLTPLSGRIEHHNNVFKEHYKQILSKIGVLLAREERTILGEQDR